MTAKMSWIFTVFHMFLLHNKREGKDEIANFQSHENFNLNFYRQTLRMQNENTQMAY